MNGKQVSVRKNWLDKIIKDAQNLQNSNRPIMIAAVTMHFCAKNDNIWKYIVTWPTLL